MLGCRRAVYTTPRPVLTLVRKTGTSAKRIIRLRSIKSHTMLMYVKIAVLEK